MARNSDEETLENGREDRNGGVDNDGAADGGGTAEKMKLEEQEPVGFCHSYVSQDRGLVHHGFDME